MNSDLKVGTLLFLDKYHKADRDLVPRLILDKCQNVYKIWILGKIISISEYDIKFFYSEVIEPPK